jgi:hypothetical protein
MILKNKIFFYKGLLIEICETLASISLYLEYDARRMHNPMGKQMRGHFNELAQYSQELRNEQEKMLRRLKNDKGR